MSDLSADAVLRKHVKWLMLDCRNNQTEVAKILDVHRNTLARWLRQWDCKECRERQKAAGHLEPTPLIGKCDMQLFSARENRAVLL
jgi:transposase-like protein